MNTRIGSHADYALEARLAATLTGGLTAAAEQLPVDVSTRLRFAREQAVARAAEVRRPVAAPAGATSVLGVSSRGVAALGAGFVPGWLRAASVLPLLALVLGLFMIDHWSAREQVVAAADVDTQLLADDLPPAAYTDPGFAEFMRSATP